MASFSPLNNTITETSTTSSPAYPFSLNKTKISALGKPSKCLTGGVTCDARNEDRPSKESTGKIDRRNLLLGLGGLYGLTGVSATGRSAVGTPIMAPDLSKCGPADFLARVEVPECLDQKNLRYTYQDVEIPWIQTRPTPHKPQAATTSTGAAKKKTVKASPRSHNSVVETSNVFPRALDSVVTVTVARPMKSRSKKQKEDEEEVLVIEGIEFEKDKFVKIDVYINDEDGKTSSAAKTEFAGSLVNVPHKHGKKMNKLKTSLRLGITDLLEDLGADDDDEVAVTLVLRQGEDVSIEGIKIVFDS